MAKTVSVAEAKRDFSDLMSRVALKGERFVIQRRGKAVAALVGVTDLETLQTVGAREEGKGLLASLAAWEDYPQLEALIADLYRAREQAKDRRVRKLP
ncbi:MAG: type II toxin-antitoxin system Phd/YefM family antitoxin [Candidatus Methylomirabilota bacterium]|nr:type II toxin-antitoxin system Phd/YefM family antitoxin [Candidatus Methylomirabilis sp.]NJD68044.1 type II toxin-antitoxin system Phd/YefM family antitoxin [candidate division NC10 bacterium]PWB47136.1 MAG: type II toxin-antitoxin system Phd/YefM family antitoxin [candidate division NC10 bacterium]